MNIIAGYKSIGLFDNLVTIQVIENEKVTVISKEVKGTIASEMYIAGVIEGIKYNFNENINIELLGEIE